MSHTELGGGGDLHYWTHIFARVVEDRGGHGHYEKESRPVMPEEDVTEGESSRRQDPIQHHCRELANLVKTTHTL